MCRRCAFSVMLFCSSLCVKAQSDEFSLASDTVLSKSDSLSIFSLIDSLLDLQQLESSQLAVRLSYNSNVLSAGRTLGIQNFGLSPGVSYFHRSGLYGDISGFWSNDFVPSYYLTVVSAGYIIDVSRRVSIMTGYDRYFYNFTSDFYIPYKNTLSVTPMLDIKPVSFSANYPFYFGDQSAHRIMPGMIVTAEKRNLWKIDRISVSPSVFALWGNEVITELEYVLPATFRERLEKSKKLRNAL